MAEDLGVSPSYLNHLEHNQRPVTAQVLLRLAEVYDIDIRSLSADHEAAGAQDLGEVFADLSCSATWASPRHEIGRGGRERSGRRRRHRAALPRLRRTSPLRRARLGAPRAEEGADSPALTPSDWVRDYIQGQRNFFPELDEAGERVAAELKAEPQGVFAAGRQQLADRHGIQVRVVPLEVLPDSVRRYDHHRRRLMVSEMLPATGRAFAVAYQLALAEHDADFDRAWSGARRAAGHARPAGCCKVSLANYLRRGDPDALRGVPRSLPAHRTRYRR